MPYSTRSTETGTTFAPEFDGTWLISPFTGKGKNDLVFIKQFNTGTNTIEVHVASADSQYKTRVFEKGTTFAQETDGTLLLVPAAGGGKPDLVFIKTENTPNNKVEVHIASGASDYQTRTVETETTFATESDGTWGMCDFTGKGHNDLYFIKTSNAETNTVEVHVASAESGYQQRIYERGTTFKQETAGTWMLRPWSQGAGSRPDLIYVKTVQTGTKSVEVHVASGDSDYQKRILETGTTFKEEHDGAWTFASTDVHPDLIFIKTGPSTGTGKVEVHNSPYQP